MLKQELATRLDEALDLLAQTTERKTTTKALRERVASFVTGVKEARAQAATASGVKTWYIARVEKDNGRTSWPNCTSDGSFPPSLHERFGKQAAEWFSVRAASRAEARQAIDAGEAEHHTRTKTVRKAAASQPKKKKAKKK